MNQLQPLLQGELIKLLPLKTDDFTALYAVASDPLIWEQHPARDRYQEPVFREFFDGGMASGGAFLIRDIATDQVLGSSRYCNYVPERSEIEIGYTFLSRAVWGGHYNAELKFLMLKHAFSFVDSVLFVVGEHNIRSQQAVSKLGASADEAHLQPHQDRIIFRLRKEQFLAQGFRYHRDDISN